MLGLLYDVHGNLSALEAVLEDARGQGVGRWLIGGDVALFGPWPAQTLARLRELPAATWIRGNADRWLADRADAPDLVVPVAEAYAAELGDDAVRELAGLPFDHVEDGVRYVHASPVSDMRSFLPEPADDEGELLAGVAERRLVFGHTHLPFRRVAANGIELINPGSVGMPLDGDVRAAWAVVHDGGEVEHRRVAYDHGATVAAVTQRFGADSPFTVRFAEARMA